MKQRIVLPILCALVCASAGSRASAQATSDDREKNSATEAVLKTGGKAASEVGKAALKVGASGAKAFGEKVVVPAAKVIWDPVLTKAAPKALGASAKLAGKGIKNGFKLIFKRERQDETVTIRRST